MITSIYLTSRTKTIIMKSMCNLTGSQTLQNSTIQSMIWVAGVWTIFGSIFLKSLKSGFSIVLFLGTINCMAAENNLPGFYYYYQDKNDKKIIYYTNRPNSEMYSLLKDKQNAKYSNEIAEKSSKDNDNKKYFKESNKGIILRLIPPGFPMKQKIYASIERDVNLVPPCKNNLKKINPDEDVIEKSKRTNVPEEKKISNTILKKPSETIRMILASVKLENFSLKTSKQSQNSIRLEDDIDQLIRKAARQYQLSPSLLKAIIKVESNFNSQAVSEKGAIGLMQIMPINFASLNIKDPFDACQNIMGGANYLRKMMDYFKLDLVKGIAAYNAGPGNVEKANGIPDIKETKLYVKNVLRYMAQYDEP